MDRLRNQKIEASRGPGGDLALLAFVVGVVSASFGVKGAFALDIFGRESGSAPYTQPAETGSRLKAREAQYDRERVFRRNQRIQLQHQREALRQREAEQQAEKAREIEEAVSQDQQIQQAIGQQQKQHGEELVSRTTGLDSYTIDENGGFWRSHLGLTVEGVNVLAGRDLYGNESRGHYYDFKYNGLFNVVGITQDVKDAAGRLTRSVVSGITYLVEYFRGIAPKDKQNLESARDVVATTFYPTGEAATRSEYRDFQYQDNKVVAETITTYDLSGPANPIRQEVSGMRYDSHDNVISSHAVATDLETGVVTVTDTENQFSGHRLVSGTTKSVTRDPIAHTLTEQSSTQSVSYKGSSLDQVEVKTLATTTAMDEGGNRVDDFVTTAETTSTMAVYANIPQTVKVVTETHTIDNVGVQETKSRQEQSFGRDAQGNLLTSSASETSRTTNADLSVVQTSEGALAFEVHADQAYLVGREDRSETHDGINETDSVESSRLAISLGSRHEVVGGEQSGESFTHNGDSSITTSSTFKRLFDRAEKANALALVSQESLSHTEDGVNFSQTEETRLYTQSHDPFNRILGAEESFTSRTTDVRNVVTEEEGTVTYAVGLRSNQPYATLATTKVTQKDPFNFLYTESTQTTTFESDPQTGRALSGTGITESISQRMQEDGTVMDILTITSRAVDTLIGLSQANGFGLLSRETVSETLDTVNNLVTHQTETLRQKLSGVGKIEEASSVAELTTEDADGAEVRQTFGRVETDFNIIANRIFAKSTKQVEETIDRTNGSYRVVAQEIVNRYDAYGRLLEFNKENPGESGFEMVFYEDITVTPIPKSPPDPQEMFEHFFGPGGVR